MDALAIQKKAHEMTGAWMEKLNSGKSFADLMQIYGDIRVELSRKAPESENLIDAYTGLMAREQILCSPQAAYYAGSEAALSGREYHPMAYINSVGLDPSNQSFLMERDALFHSLCGLLAETELMDEYNELYRYCHGSTNWKIEQYYHWGYYGTMPESEKTQG